MPARSLDGFVVRKSDFGDLDRIVVLVSPGEGRIDGIAKGARRWKGGWGAALEPLSWVRVQVRDRPGRDLARFERIELLRSSFDVLADPEGLVTFAHVAEVTETVAVPGQPHERLVRLVHALLDAARGDGIVAEPGSASRPASTALRSHDRLKLYFDVWVARLEGFWPDLGACGSCAEPLSGPRRVGLHAEGALCARCAREASAPTSGLSEEAVRLAAAIAARSPAALAREAPGARAERELQALASALLASHLDKPLRTLPAHARAGRGARKGPAR